MSLLKKSLAVGLAAVAVSSTFARGEFLSPLTPWVGAGFFSNNLPQPTDTGYTKTNQHYTLGLGLYYRKKVMTHWDVGPEVSYLYSSNTDLNTANYRWRYTSQIIPAQVVGTYHASSEWSFTGGMGIALAFQKLNYTITNTTVDAPVVDVSGHPKRWRPIISVGLQRHMFDGFDVGLQYRRVFGDTVSPFTSTTTSDVNADTRGYRRVPGQNYIFMTLDYRFN